MRDCGQKVSDKQQKVLLLLTKEFETPKQVSIRLGISDKRVYQIIKILKKKGLINNHYQAIEKSGGTIQGGRGFRLHDQQLHISPVWVGEKYKSRIGGLLSVDGNSVMVYRDSVEVYSNTFFFGESVVKVTGDSVVYWNKFLRRLESELDCVILKANVCSVRFAKQGHYAEVDNELAVEVNAKADKVRLYTDDDGKLWFVCDNSFGFNEAETTHPKTSGRDMEAVVGPFMNTLRNNPNVLEDLFRAIKEVVKVQGVQADINKESACTLAAVLELVKPKEVFEVGPEVLGDRPSYIG